MTGPTTLHLQRCLDRLRAGDGAARDELIRHSQDRLRALTGRMLARFPNVRRWEDTDDVLQEVLLRIKHLLDRVEVVTVRDYLRLAATNIRRCLIDLARHYDGPHGLGANYATPPPGGRDVAPEPGERGEGPDHLAGWGEFHEHVGRLPDDESEVFDLLWYHELTQDEAAEVLNVSLSTVKRRWQAARVRLMEGFDHEPPF